MLCEMKSAPGMAEACSSQQIRDSVSQAGGDEIFPVDLLSQADCSLWAQMDQYNVLKITVFVPLYLYNSVPTITV